MLKKKQKMDKGLIENLLEKHECSEYRIVRPDELITTDWVEDRLNIYVNDEEEVIQINKG